MGRMLRVVGCVGALVVLVVPVATGDDLAGRWVEADAFTDTAGPLAAGEFEVSVLSTRAETVTAGDALVGVRGVDADEDVRIARNGERAPVRPDHPVAGCRDPRGGA